MNRLSEIINQKIQTSLDEFEQFVIAFLASKNMQYFKDPFKLNLISIRGTDDHSNLFDDTEIVMFYDGDGQLHADVFDITTHPGLEYCLNPIPGTGGAGILVEGQYIDAFMLGSHTSRINGVQDVYPCLTQAIGLPVYRDNVKDGHLYFDPKTIAAPAFIGLQQHRAMPNGETQLVVNWSAACQVHENGTRYTEEFWPMVEKHLSLYPRVSYTLLKEQEFLPAA